MNSKIILSSVASSVYGCNGAKCAGFAATGVQVGASGKTYVSSGVQCALNPIIGMAPLVKAVIQPKTNASATVSLNDTAV